MKIITENREAKHNYFLDDFVEAGIVLEGSEVKSIRAGKVNLKDTYVVIRGLEAFLLNCHITSFEKTSAFAPDPKRTRKLLLNRSEINKLTKAVKVKGFTIVPTKMVMFGNFVKVEIAIAKGKELHNKKDAIKEKDIKRETDRELKNFR